MIYSAQQKGFSLIELLVAMTVFTIGVSSVIFLTLDAHTVSRRSTERTQAILLAQEGLEATRSIRDGDFENLVNGSHGLVLQDGKWVFSNTSDTVGKFTRTVSVVNTTVGGGASGGSSGGINGGSNNNGIINVCVTAIDSNKNQNTGFGYANSFQIVLRKPNNGASWTIAFNTPLIPTNDLLSDAPGLDSACVTNIQLPYGRYSYNIESIVNGGSNWQTPKYNDQYTSSISTVDDFFTYSSNVDSDGLIDVLVDRPSRTLVLLNQLTPATTLLNESLTVKSVTSAVSWPITPTKSGLIQFVEYFTEWDHAPITDISCFSIDLTDADIEHGSSNKIIRYIDISNPSCNHAVTIDKMVLTWNKPSAKLTKVRIANSFLWQGSVSSGATIDLSPNQTLSAGAAAKEIDQLRWDKSILGTDIDVKFIMSDASFQTFTIPAF